MAKRDSRRAAVQPLKCDGRQVLSYHAAAPQPATHRRSIPGYRDLIPIPRCSNILHSSCVALLHSIRDAWYVRLNDIGIPCICCKIISARSTSKP